MPNYMRQGNLTERESPSAVDLLIKIACFVKKKKHTFSVLKAVDLN